MYDFGIPPADTVAGDILRRAPPLLDASDGMVLANFTVASDDLTWVTIVSTTILVSSRVNKDVPTMTDCRDRV